MKTFGWQFTGRRRATALTAAFTLAIGGLAGPLAASAGADNNGPNAVAIPASVDFGDVVIGNSATQTVVVVASDGDDGSDHDMEDLIISNVVISGGDFAITATDCPPFPRTLAEAESCTVDVTFTPTVVGTRTGTLTIVDNEDDGPLVVPLTGNGVPVPTVSARVSPTPVNFGNVIVGRFADRTVTITSTGGLPLQVTNVTITGAAFAIVGNSCGPPFPKTLTTSQSCSVTVRFTPPAVGAFNGTLTFLDNAGSNPEIVPLFGNGIALPGITAAGINVNGLTECRSFTAPVANFTDAAAAPGITYTAVINWGDGSPTTNGTISQTGPTTFQVSGTHTYSTPGTFTITTTITPSDGRAAAVATSTATVGHVPLTTVNDGTPVSGQEGQTLTTVTGRFRAGACTTPGSFSASIDWGDGFTTVGTIVNFVNGTFDVRGSHAYREEGTYHIVTTVKLGATETATAVDTATITDAPIHATGSSAGVNNGREPGHFTGTPGTPSTGGLATFTDENPFGMLNDFTATVDWGDGFTTSGLVTGPAGPSSGPWQVTGSHQYDCAGIYNIRIIVTDDGGSSSVAMTTATVAAATDVLDVVSDVLHCQTPL